jgi:hypothetical protein
LRYLARTGSLAADLNIAVLVRQPSLYKKRKPVDWRRYTAHVRRAEKKLARRRHPFLATVIGSIVFAIAGSMFAQAVGVSVLAGLGDLGGSLVSALPQNEDSELVIGETQVTVSTAPILDTLPEFVKANGFQFEGRVPAFALNPDSVISLSLNGKVIADLTIAPDGRFSAPLQLQDGSNTIKAALVEGSTEIAATSHTVVVDREAPKITILRPTAGQAIEGDEVIIEGSTEAAADVTINDRALRPNPDGTFTERVLATPGPFKLVIVARDKAGNETKTEINVNVSEGQPGAAGLTLWVSLDRTLVKPGQTVIAEVHAVQDGQLRPDVPVTVQVGVTTIGTYRTDASGIAQISFKAPNHEAEEVTVIVLAGGTSGRATFAVAK